MAGDEQDTGATAGTSSGTRMGMVLGDDPAGRSADNSRG
jgi:hypothetical protein